MGARALNSLRFKRCFPYSGRERLWNFLFKDNECHDVSLGRRIVAFAYTFGYYAPENEEENEQLTFTSA